MALAILEYGGHTGSAHRFSFQLGSNQYFQIYIGGVETHLREGMRMMSKITDQSPIIGPVQGSFHHYGSVNIPDLHFGDDHLYVQLVSFRDTEGNSPVVSEIKRVYPVRSSVKMPERLTISSFSLNGNTMNETINSPLEIEEVKYTEGMFLDTVLKVLPSITDLIGSITKKKGGSGEEKPDVGALLGDNDKMIQFVDILKKLLSKSGAQSFSSGLERCEPFIQPSNEPSAHCYDTSDS